MGVYSNKSLKSEWIWINRARAGLGSFVYLIHRKLKLGRWRKLHFLVAFCLEMAFKCFNGSHKVVFYNISGIM